MPESLIPLAALREPAREVDGWPWLSKSKQVSKEIIDYRLADENHAVVTVVGEGSYRKTPCLECPWRKENAGSFPAEAFRLSASTSTDIARHTFACHMAGATSPKTCAGFIMSASAQDNFAMRIAWAKGEMRDCVPDGADLFETYRQMAVANGVGPREKVLRDLMPEARKRRYRR